MYTEKNDTICAIATGLGKSAIGKIRVSGPEAIEICNGIFIGKKRISEMETFTAAFGRIVDQGKQYDEVIALVMKAPHTYTTEDTVELDLHGGPFVMRRVMELLINRGARVAEPGEFTKRAFLGGRIDMTEAEAVMDVINSETDMALSASLNQLSGSLRNEISDIREKLIYNTAYIESAIDDPEHYELDGYADTLQDTINEILGRLEKLLAGFDEGRLIREGICTAIVGRPNVGKSSILNTLLGEERAIVTDIEGTTRDTLEEYISLDGIVLKLIDTAGIRETDDKVEKIGVDKARTSISSADLVLLVLDGSDEITDDDFSLIKSIKDKKVIVLINKSDKEESFDAEKIRTVIANEFADSTSSESSTEGTSAGSTQVPSIIEFSAKTGGGKELLKAKISELFYEGHLDYNSEVCITNVRHKGLVVEAEESLKKVLQSIEAGVGEDFYTIDLMAAYEALGTVIGESLEDDLADKIFKEFCMGK